MKVDFYLETRKSLDLGITRKVYTGNLLQRIFRIGPYREEKIFDPMKGIFTRSDSLEISVLVYSKEWEWIDTLYYGNKNVEDSHIRLLHLVSEEAYRVEIDLKYLSMSYKYLVFVAHSKKKNESEQVRLGTEVRYDSRKEPLTIFLDLTDNEWQIVGYLENNGKNSRFIETWEKWSKLETGTLLDIEKQFKDEK